MREPAANRSDVDALRAVLPAPLRRLLDAELAAGNRVVAVGHSFPAPPCGAFLQLERAVSTRPPGARDGIVHRERNSSLCAGEFSDARAEYFLLEPPRPPPGEPDMDAIRAAADAPRPRPARTITPERPWIVEVDHRGESMTYREADRSATVDCSLGSRSVLYAGTLGDWFYPAERRRQAMTAGERAEVLARIVECCAREQGIARLEIED